MNGAHQKLAHDPQFVETLVWGIFLVYLTYISSNLRAWHKLRNYSEIS